MSGIVLNVDVRPRTGTGGAREARRQGLVPGVLYGGPRGPVPISLTRKELMKALTAGKFISHMVELDYRGERQPVIPKEVQFHPVTDEPMHIDLYRVEENQLVKVEVPAHFINHEASPGLKRGGTLNVVRHTVEMWAPASAIPEEIVADLTGLDIGDTVRISAFNVPQGVEPVITNRDFVVATVAGSAAERSDEAAADAAKA
jgi:large subunit ribosomal protein L25